MSWLLGICMGSPAVYDRLSKKDEQYGIEQITQWKNRHSSNEKYPREKIEHIKEHAKRVLKDIPVALTSSNYLLVEDHLVTLAKENDYLRESFINQIDILNSSPSIKKEISIKLIMTCSKRTCNI